MERARAITILWSTPVALVARTRVNLMKVLNNKMGFVAVLACAVVASATVLRADGNVKLTATSTLLNPCNGEIAMGPVDVLLSVKVSQSANGVSVKVHRSFHGELTGDDGNVYHVSSIGKGEFAATAPFYDFTFHNNVIGQGSAPDFEANGTVRVFVNANQEPTTYSASGVSVTCK
jgi:hypothetical protein